MRHCRQNVDLGLSGDAAIDCAMDVKREWLRRCGRGGLLVAMRARPFLAQKSFATRLWGADQSYAPLSFTLSGPLLEPGTLHSVQILIQESFFCSPMTCTVLTRQIASGGLPWQAISLSRVVPILGNTYGQSCTEVCTLA